MIKLPHYILFLLLLYQHNLVAQLDSLTGPVPADLLLKDYVQSNFRISPNGKFFLEVLEENYESHIVIIDIDGYKLKNRIAMETSDIGEVSWLTNNRILYEKLGQIFAIDIDGSNRLRLVTNRADKRVKNYYRYHLNYRYNSILSMLPEVDDEVIIESFDTEGNAYVKKVNVFTGEKETLLNGKALGINKWFADKNGNVNLGVKFSKDSWTYLRKSVNSDKWYPIELHIGNEFYPFKLEGESFLKENVMLVDTDYDEDVVYLASNLGSDKRHLIKYNFKGRFVMDTIAKDINCDVSYEQGQDLRLLFDEVDKKLGGVRYEGILPEFKAISKNFVDIKAKLQDKFPSRVNDIVDFDDSFQRFVVYQWSDTYAGNIGIFDAVSGEYYVMFHLNQELNQYKLSKTRSIAVKAKDGYNLSAYLTLPPNFRNTDGIPLVVVPHGGPWARDYWSLDVYGQFFASRGYAVLRVNYRGSAGFGKKHLQSGIKELGGVMINDIVEATLALQDEYNIDKDKIFIYGHSYGGYATYMALARYPEVFSAGVAVAAPTDIKVMLKKQKKDGNKFSYDYWNYALGENDTDFFKKISPINHVQRINTPLLVFHGKLDRIVPIEQTNEMEKRFKELKKNNATFRTLEFLGHGLDDSNSHGYVLKEAEEFFRNTFSSN